jgi:hypothetical protein
MIKLTPREYVDSINTVIPLYLGRRINLTHKVRLSYADKEGKRLYYHAEFKRKSTYKDPPRVSTLRLTHSSILVLENKEGEGYLESVVINLNNRDFFVAVCKEYIQNVLKMDDLIEYDDDDRPVKINSKYRSFQSQFQPYKGKVVTLKPCVIKREGEDHGEEGVSITLDARSYNPIQIPINTFDTLVREVDRFDFHLAGLIAVTYLQSAEIGVHEVEISESFLTDFDVDMVPVYKEPKKQEESSISKLQTRSSLGGNHHDRGW